MEIVLCVAEGIIILVLILFGSPCRKAEKRVVPQATAPPAAPQIIVKTVIHKDPPSAKIAARE